MFSDVAATEKQYQTRDPEVTLYRGGCVGKASMDSDFTV